MCANEACNLFLDTFLMEFDKCCPIKQVRKKKNSLEGIDDNCYSCFCKNEE
jgi:hypothetical protein